MNYPRPDRRWTGPEIEDIARKRLQRHEQARVEIAHELAVNGTRAPDYQARGKRPVIADRLYPLVLLCHAHGLPEPMPEYQFSITRGFRFDYAFIAQKIGVEIEGGIWRGYGAHSRSTKAGAHSHPLAIERDIEKSNLAAVEGWRILRVVPERIGDAIPMLKAMLA